MVDLKKRKTLLSMGTATLASAVPSVALALTDSDNKPKACAARGDCNELRLELTLAQTPSLRISNDSDHPATLRHVHPGIVHAGGRTFNINTLFANGPLRIEAGRSVTLAIDATKRQPALETRFARHRYARQPQRIARLRGADENGLIVNSTRSFYS